MIKKAIRFTPKTLTLTNNAGLSLELSDQKGITITSNQGIYLNGDQNISISSGGGISVYGNDSVSVKQGASHIKVANEIDIVGGRINMN